jgi:transcriptional regulator with GAF, ATPase, and Fis domain
MEQRYCEILLKKSLNSSLRGESGTGKEFVARTIHRFSNRAEHASVLE